ncbi:MAG TPA: helix-turn-helix transcriptional regulator, partial [Candidatus Acidoferrum sp.]|nr:helix-turn-helix transcriptional regulator [Candidatus Acidoferrum sp.]
TDDLAARVRSVLASKNLTLSRVSQASAAQYGRSSPYFLPHTLYHEFRLGTFSPSLHQVFALSQISGYKLSDWLRVLGCDLEDIPRLQVLLPSKRTKLLDSSLVDAEAWIPWFRNRTSSAAEPPIAPLAQLLEVTRPRRLRFLSGIGKRGYLYAKIGRQDALAFPDLVPGSIVRVNPRLSNGRIPRTNGSTCTEIFLLEHSKGLFCCRLRIVEKSIVIPIGVLLSYAQVEMKIPREARILGVVDVEIRPMLLAEQPEVPKDLAKHWKPRPLVAEKTFGQLLRAARTKPRLSLREVAVMSRKIVDLLGDRRYSVSPSSLSDYEQFDAAPRHFHKAVTLCSLYGLQFRVFLKAIGIVMEEAGTEPIPDHLARRTLEREPVENSNDNDMSGRSGFLEHMLERCEEIPFFLRQSIGPLSGLEDPSLDDWFWIGGEYDVLHPCLANGLFAIVNRRDRRPIHFTSKPAWQQPVYVIQLRNGTYLCACCGIENGTLVIHPYSDQFRRSERLRYHHDAEVVGRIVMVARKLG